MCNKNINEITNIDFSSVSDETNWNVDGSGSVSTIGGVLNFSGSNRTTIFKRFLGSKLVINNRLRIRSNIQVKKSIVLGSPDIDLMFTVKNNLSETIDEFVVNFESLGDGGTYLYFLDRTLNVANHNTFNLEVSVLFGNTQEINLKDLIVEDFFFCEEDLRTYFVIDDLFEDSLVSESAGIKLNSWKVEGIETLTSSFFAATNIIGSKPIDDWFFSKSDLNGENRVAETLNPKTFNPFIQDWNLLFSDDNYKGGKPTGTEGGQDFGQGLLNIGIDKPCVINGLLELKKGAFFIDIDYTKNLRVEFDVIVNENSSNLYVDPLYIKKFVIEWDSVKCQKHFYFIDSQGIKMDQSVNGFLSGITGVQLLESGNAVGCDETFSPTGNQGNFTYEIDFGSTMGTAGINYNAYGVPDRFILEWNGQTFDSGFVGLNSYDQQLLDLGIDPSDINTGIPSTGSGQLTFNKDSATPTTATITVVAPFSGTGWQVTGQCPQQA